MIIDQNIMKNFFQVLMTPIKRTVFETLDKTHFSELSIDLVGLGHIENELIVETENRPIYINTFRKEEQDIPYMVTFSDMFIKKISDIHMGGTGDIDPEDVINELDTNAIRGIMKKMEKNILLVCNEICTVPISISEDETILTPKDEKYKEQILNSPVDFYLSFRLCVRSEECMVAKWFLTEDAINSILAQLNLDNDMFKNLIDETSKINLNTIGNIDLDLTAELGNCKLPIKTALELTKGSYIALDTKTGEDIKIYVNGVVVGEGEVVVVGDNFGIRIKKLYGKNKPEAQKQ